MDKSYFVYRHVRLDKNVPFYIGIGTALKEANNFNRYYKRAFLFTSSRSKRWFNIAQKSDILVDIIFETNDYNEAAKKEIEFISLYKRKEDGGTLINMSSGGEIGSKGVVISIKTRKLLSIKNKGKKLSTEHKLKIGQGNKGVKKKWSIAAINKMVSRSIANCGDKHSCAKLNEIQVRTIIGLYNSGVTRGQIGKMYLGVTKQAIYLILKKKNWKHLSNLINPNIKADKSKSAIMRKGRTVDIGLICSDYKSGLSLDKIASKHQMDRHFIKKVLSENNIPLFSKKERSNLKLYQNAV